MNGPDRYTCTATLRFDPWGYAGDADLQVLLPLPADDGYQRIDLLDAPPGEDIIDAHGHRRLIRLEHGQVATLTARVETRRLRHGDYLDLPGPCAADMAPAPMIVPDAALAALAANCIEGIDLPAARIAALARAAADALRYRYPRDARGAALSLQRGWGDCGEYAFVFVALCHCAGIPARPVFGLITAPWMATPHAWAEAWDGQGWLPVDPNLVREGGYLGPILETGSTAQDHIGALDPYRLVLSRHAGLLWPGAVPRAAPPGVAGLTLTLDGIGPVTFWHEAPRWQGVPVVPFLQMPWAMVHRPSKARLATLLRRLRPWRFAIRHPSRRLPRNPLVLADIVALHPLKGVAGVAVASLTLPLVPSLAPVLQGAIWVWFWLFAFGFLRSLRIMRLRSALWLRLQYAAQRRLSPRPDPDPGTGRH